MKKLMIVVVLVAIAALTACRRDADIASRNLSVAADMFEIDRRVVFYNGITDKYIFIVEGKCSLGSGSSTRSLTVTCKIGPEAYKKHFLGLSDNVTYFAEQLKSKGVSVYHHRVVFKPQTIIPEVDVRVSTKELLQNKH